MTEEEEKKIADLLDSLITSVIKLRMLKDEITGDVDYLCNIIMEYRKYLIEIKAEEFARMKRRSDVGEDVEG